MAYSEQTDRAPIAVLMPRSVDAVVAILAILKTGKAFLPIDISYPSEKVRVILEDAKVTTVISHTSCESLAQQLPQDILYFDQLKSEQLGSEQHKSKQLRLVQPKILESIKPSDIAYVLYTSGSTGVPKGVEITHASLANYLSWAREYYTDGKPLDFALFTSLSFDLSITSLFLPLMLGSKLIVYPQKFDANSSGDGASSAMVLRKVIDDNQANVIKLTPSHLALIQDMDLSQHSLQKVIVGGDDFKTETACALHDLAKGNISIYNEYGPTEATVACSVYEFNPEQSVSATSLPIGQPIDNCQIYILDEHMNAVPQGVVGDLYIAGQGLAKGYLHNQAMTEERFVELVTDAHTNETVRLYKSGDLACYDSAGNIHYLGRSDRQIKVRGVRLETGEIEAALLSMPMVTDAAVELIDSQGNTQLTAFYSASSAIHESDILDYLQGVLSSNAIPQTFIYLQAMPLTNNGKIERSQLVEIANTQTGARQIPGQDTLVANSEIKKLNAIESRLLEVWKRFLHLETIGIHDNFFSIGGDSIITIQVVVAAKEQGINISPQQVFAHPTIEALSRVANTEKSIIATQELVTGKLPLLAIQKNYLENDSSENHQFVQSVSVEYEHQLSDEAIYVAFEQLLSHHDGLRTRINRLQQGSQHDSQQGSQHEWQAEMLEHSGCISQSYQLGNDETLKHVLEKQRAELLPKLDIGNGVLLAYSHISDGAKSRLLIMVHHLVMDGISWWILLSDLEKCISNAEMSVKTQTNTLLPLKTCSLKQWGEALVDYVNSEQARAAKDFWLNQFKAADYPRLQSLSKQQAETSLILDQRESDNLSLWASKSNENSIPHLLLCALHRCSKWFKQHDLLSQNDELLINLEGHGRESIIEGMDITRTIGWFTSVYPVALQHSGNISSLDDINTQMNNIPNNGVDYGLLQCFSQEAHVQEAVHSHAKPLVLFNYLSEWERNLDSSSQFSFVEALTSHHAEAVDLEYAIEMNSMFFEQQLHVSISYDEALFNKETITTLLAQLDEHINALIQQHCDGDQQQNDKKQFSSANLNDDELADLLSEFSE